ncbi:hypothetical protein DPMN_011231 [Dreissena polymorpha]|uniref:Uncharacterized protein n=1 Tax=Dreissena polymorpha TaxID=45954 RepID=A0A9D4N3N3_DREPO|nr:hypothetical protein DPMN_011231 [Dreissena polymorpha]
MINASKFHIPNEIEDTKAIDIVKTIVCISVDKDVEISQHVADAYDNKKTNNTDNGQFISSASGDEICDKNIAKHMGIAYDDEDADDNDNAQDMMCASDDDDDDKCDNLAKHRDIAYADKDTDDNDNAQDMAGAGDDDEKCDNNLPKYRVISYDVEDTDENYNAKHMVSAVDNKNTDDNHYVCHLGSAEDYKNVAGNDEVENTDNQDNAQQMAGAGYYDNNLAKHTNKAYDDEDTDDKDNTQHTGSDSDNENLDGKDKAQHMAGAGDDKDKYKNIALDDEDTNEYDNAEHIASAGDGENTDDNQPDYKMGSTYDCKGVDDVENTDDKYDAQNLAGAGDDEDMSDNNPAIHAVIANDDEVTDYHDNAEQVASAGDNKYTDDNHYFSNMGCSDHYKHTENKDYAEHNITVDGNEYPHNQDTTEDIVRTHENKHIEFKDNGKTTACDGTDDKDNVKNNAAGNGDIDDNNDTNNTASTYNFQNADEIEQKTLNVNGKQPHLHSNNSEFCDSATEELFSDCVEQPKCSTPIHSVSVTLYASDEASYKKIDQVEFSDAFGIIDTRCGQDSLDQPEDQPDITNTDAKNADYCNGDERNNMFDHHREKILVEIGASSVEPNHREKQTSHFLKYMSKPVTRMLNVEVKHFHEENQPKILPLESTIRCTLMDDNDSLDSNCTVSYCEDQNNMVNAADFEHLLPFNTIESKERQDIDKEISDRKLSKVDRDVKLNSINDSNFCKDKNVHYMIKESNSAYNTTASDSSDIASALSQRPTSSRNLATLDFNIEDYQPGGIFCESIAEKVKRKQRERALPVIYNPWLYDGCSNSSRKTIPKKEISVFRSAILEKRARERSESLDKAEGPASKKIKLSSKTEYAHEKKHR